MEDVNVIGAGNRIIAVFDGWEENRFKNLPNKLHREVGKELHGIHIDYLNYHSDWNLLMGVVEKIENKGFVVQINSNYCEIGGTNIFNNIPTIKQICKTKIDSTFTAVVEFIKSYNQNTNI